MSDTRWDRIAHVFGLAMDAAHAERQAILDRECAGDEALRAEVEELLAADESTASDVANVVAEAVNAMVTRGDDHVAADRETLAEAGLAPGDTVDGRYIVKRVLGAGGMGVVVGAEHRGLAEQVAIKLLKPGALATERARLRFLREAKAAARIKSPHVVKVRDVGVLPSGAPFMVMDLLDGADLASVLKARGRLPYTEACLITLQACEALATAHARGVIHRDIKPGNLFLERAAHGELHVKLLDFGISKLSEREGDDEGALTRSTDMMGSPAYMSPEQLRSARDADARSDLWSLGVVLYEMLAGVRPFPGPSLADVSMKILSEPPPALDADCPPALRQVVTRCLEKDRANRYRNVGELAIALAPLCGVEGHRGARRVLATLGAPPDPADVVSNDDEDIASLAETLARPADVGAVSTSASIPMTKRPALLTLAVLVAIVAIGTAAWLGLRDDATETEPAAPEPPPPTFSVTSASATSAAQALPTTASSPSPAREPAPSSRTHVGAAASMAPRPRSAPRPAPSIDPYGTRK